MELETVDLKSEDIEEGELIDSDEGYTPLQRPNVPTKICGANQVENLSQVNPVKMEGVADNVDDSQSEFGPSTDSSSDSDDDVVNMNRGSQSNKQKKIRKRTVLLRVKPIEQMQNKARFKKYDIWTASLQEESLTENMREIGVNRCLKQDRSVESYDFTWKYRSEQGGGGGGRGLSLKRRLSDSGEEHSDTFKSKHKYKRAKRNPQKQGSRILNRSEDSTSSCDSQNFPRHLKDLSVSLESDCAELAKDLANKLFEEKDDLLLRVIEVVGKEKTVKIFKETQRIEKDGGMMIQTGQRRRTPGGVFLFLLKQDDEISAEDKKQIFEESLRKTNRERKLNKNSKRDKKVEELKKQLSLKEKELTALATRAELAVNSHTKVEDQSNLSNPPPSPVTNGGLESSPDYSAHAINHVVETSSEKGHSKHVNDEELISYDDDILDVNYDEMDMF